MEKVNNVTKLQVQQKYHKLKRTRKYKNIINALTERLGEQLIVENIKTIMDETSYECEEALLEVHKLAKKYDKKNK